MKKLLALLFACLCASAQAQTSYAYINIVYTPGAASCLGGDANARSTLTSMANLVTSDWSSQGITVPFGVTVNPIAGAPPDGTTSASMYVWNTTNVQAWQARKNASAAGQIIVSNPGASDGGFIPTAAPTLPQDANGAINCSDLAHQLKPAMDRIAGITPSNGMTVRARTYNGDNVCFHTQDGQPSDASVLYPYLQGYQAGGTLNTRSPTAAGSCELYRKAEIAMHSGDSGYAGYFDHTALTTLPPGPNTYTCTTYKADNTVTSSASIGPWSQGTGSDTIYCGAAGDQLLANYSCTTSCNARVYSSDGTQSWPIGDATHDAITAVNNRLSLLVGPPGGMQGGNATNLQKAQNGVSWVPTWWPF